MRRMYPLAQPLGSADCEAELPHDPWKPRSLIEKTAKPWSRKGCIVPGSTLEPPYPWPMMISGYGPSDPDEGAGGKATLTSIGTPSHVFVVVSGCGTLPGGWVLPQK